MTMIPIYSLVSESFTNWRNMEESAGRRFKRCPLRIDATTVSTLSEEQLTALTADPRIAELAEAMLILDRQTGTSPCRTNFGLFRCYAQIYMARHPKVVHSLPVLARYLPWDERPDVGNIRLLDRKIVSGLRASGSRPAQPLAGGHARFRTAAIPTAGRSLRLRVRKPFPDNKRFRTSRKRNSAGLTRSPDTGRGAHGAPLPL